MLPATTVNAAVGIARLGGRAAYCGPVGEDSDGLLNNIATLGIATGDVVRVPACSSVPTRRAARLLSWREASARNEKPTLGKSNSKSEPNLPLSAW